MKLKSSFFLEEYLVLFDHILEKIAFELQPMKVLQSMPHCTLAGHWWDILSI